MITGVTALLDSPPGLDETLQGVADLAVGELADWCVVDLDTAEGRHRTVAVAHRDPAMVALARTVHARYPDVEPDPARKQVVTDLMPLHITELTDEMLRASAQDPEHLAILRDLQVTSVVSVALQSAGRGFGVMALLATHGRRFVTEDVELAVELGRLAGAAVEKARLYARQAALTRDLQLSESRYRSLVEATSIAVFRVDANGESLAEPPSWHASDSPVDGVWSWLGALHPDERQATLERWQELLRQGRPYELTYRVLRAEGGWRWLRARAAPITDQPADPAAPIAEWVGAIEDVTDAIRLRERSEALRRCAEELSRAITVQDVLRSLRETAAAALDATGVVIGLDLGHDRLEIYEPQYDGRSGGVLRKSLSDESDVPFPTLREALVSGESVFVQTPAEMLARAAHLPAAIAPIQAAIDDGQVCWAVAPLRYGGDVLGAARFGWRQSQVFDGHHRETMAAIAAQHAQALVRARLYDVERQTSLTLQRALAPEISRRIGGLSTGVAYRAAGAQSQVGGDWVDAFVLADGRVCLVVGDVMGSGIQAAATMGGLRTALVALALRAGDAGGMLADLDQLVATNVEQSIATVGLAVVDARRGEVDLYGAGHLPAILACSSDGVVVGPLSVVPPVGVGWGHAGVRPQPTTLSFPPGSTVVLYTDGLIETRTDSIDDRVAVLRDEVARALPFGPDLDREAARLVSIVSPAADPDDDITLLLARLD